MYVGLIDILLWISLAKGMIVALGFIFGIGAIVWWFYAYHRCDNRDTYKRQIIMGFVFTFLCWCMIAVGTSLFLKPEWQIARAVAKQVDTHIVSNPESTFNPDILIGHADKAILSVFTILQDAPANIQKLVSGQSMTQIQAEREAAQRQAEFQEFLRWREQQ